MKLQIPTAGSRASDLGFRISLGFGAWDFPSTHGAIHLRPARLYIPGQESPAPLA